MTGTTESTSIFVLAIWCFSLTRCLFKSVAQLLTDCPFLLICGNYLCILDVRPSSYINKKSSCNVVHYIHGFLSRVTLLCLKEYLSTPKSWKYSFLFPPETFVLSTFLSMIHLKLVGAHSKGEEVKNFHLAFR